MFPKLTRSLAVSALAAGALVAATAAVTPASAENERIEVGVLTCRTQADEVFFLGSSRTLACLLEGPHGMREAYHGEITRFGLDLGRTKTHELVWAVMAPATGKRDGVLDGRYTGVSAEATPGVGIGANVLLGGFDRSIVLQPISVAGQTGLAVGAGVAGLHLRAQ